MQAILASQYYARQKIFLLRIDKFSGTSEKRHYRGPYFEVFGNPTTYFLYLTRVRGGYLYLIKVKFTP